MNTYIVMGVNDWPERDQKDFEIIAVKEGESFDAAIIRAKEHYSDELQCYVVDQDGNRVTDTK